ncbi:MAG: hypothetical protein AAGA67_05605, partial [Cyanobacteria bacterium P01_F01_bin.153]
LKVDMEREITRLMRRQFRGDPKLILLLQTVGVDDVGSAPERSPRTVGAPKPRKAGRKSPSKAIINSSRSSTSQPDATPSPVLRDGAPKPVTKPSATKAPVVKPTTKTTAKPTTKSTSAGIAENAEAPGSKRRRRRRPTSQVAS